jgi:hypothetical protein
MENLFWGPNQSYYLDLGDNTDILAVGLKFWAVAFIYCLIQYSLILLCLLVFISRKWFASQERKKIGILNKVIVWI